MVSEKGEPQCNVYVRRAKRAASEIMGYDTFFKVKPTLFSYLFIYLFIIIGIRWFWKSMNRNAMST